MPVKKGKTASPAIRYLLSADRRLQKISLRKITERVRKAKPVARSRQAKVTGRTTPAFPHLVNSPRAILLGITGVLVAAALITARQPSPRIDETTAAGIPQIGAVTDIASESLPTETKRDRPSSPITKPAPAPKARAASAPSAPSTPSSAPSSKPASPTRISPSPDTRAGEASPATVNEEATPSGSTITGCIESDEGTFWLKDTSGDDAPRARSWKSGFFKKRSVRVELQDPSHTLRLGSYVGQRVSASGTLIDREMRARSLRRIAGSCD